MVMAPPKFLLVVVVLVSVFVANATQPPAMTLHLPVFFRQSSPSPHATPNTLRYPLALASSVSPTGHDDRPLRSPVQSGMAHDSGDYFAALGVGTPSNRAFLVIDTGSDFTWLQCAPCRRCHAQMTPLYDPRGSSTYTRVPFSAPRCRDLAFPVQDRRTGGCLYTLVYADGSSSSGEVATDALAFSNDTLVIHNVTLGCGHDNEGHLSSAGGVLGIGRGVLSFSAQLAAAGYGRVFSYCLGDRMARAPSASSYLVFGRTPEPPSMAFTPLRTNPRKPSQYCVDMVGFSVDGKRVAGFSSADLTLDPATGRGGVVVDSGAAISRFAWDTYAALRDAFDARAAAAGMRNVRKNISLYDTCYDLKQGIDSIATARVPTVVLHFAGGADMVLPTKNYLVQVEVEGRWTYYCLGFMGFKPSDVEHNTLGNVQQQGFQIVFDEERERIGFAPNECSD